MKNGQPAPRGKICFVVTSPITVQAFLLCHLKSLSKDYDVTVVTNLADGPTLNHGLRGVNFSHAPISRRVHLSRDLVAILRIFAFLRAEGFDAVISVTPKAGLLTAIAAFCARTRVRVHWFTGQVWATKKNPFRFVLKSADRVIALLSTALLADSKGQEEFLRRERVLSAKPCSVLGEGSISGVNVSRFAPNPSLRKAVRAELGIPEGADVIIFLGRINRDKGVLDLASAIALLETSAEVHSIWVGVDEGGLVPELRQLMSKSGRDSHFVGSSLSPERYLAAADILCLPSYREGFGTAVLEAAAAGLPAVVSDVYGLSDAVVKGVTGVVAPVGNVRELSACIGLLTRFPHLRVRLGRAARARAVANFRDKDVTLAFEVFLALELKTSRLPL